MERPNGRRFVAGIVFVYMFVLALAVLYASIRFDESVLPFLAAMVGLHFLGLAMVFLVEHKFIDSTLERPGLAKRTSAVMVLAGLINLVSFVIDHLSDLWGTEVFIFGFILWLILMVSFFAFVIWGASKASCGKVNSIDDLRRSSKPT